MPLISRRRWDRRKWRWLSRPLGASYSSHARLHKTVYTHSASFEGGERRMCRCTALGHWDMFLAVSLSRLAYLSARGTCKIFLHQVSICSFSTSTYNIQLFDPSNPVQSQYQTPTPDSHRSPFPHNLQPAPFNPGTNPHSNHQNCDTRAIDVLMERTVDVFIQRTIETRTATPTQLPPARLTVNGSL